MKKGNKTRIVSAWLLLLMWFGMSATSWAADSDIVTSVTYNEKDTTFTIRRSDTTKATWVNYRTLDGTAIGGQHFDHKAGRLYFEHGVFEQKVKMKEYGAGTSIYAYGNNVNRVYYFEAWNSFCEPIIASSREITNPYSYTSHNDGWRTLNLGGDFWWNDDYDVWRECYLSNAISASENQYRKATGQVDWWYEFYTDFRIEHRDNGWYHAWFYWGGNQIHSFTYEDAWSGWYREPGGTFWKRVSDCNDYGYKFQVKWRSDGNDDDYSKIAELYLRCRYVDSQKPSPIKLACNTLYPYASGDELYVSVCYNEIVNFTQNQTSYIIYSNIGDLEYISGAGTNVLSFKTKINKAEDVSGLKITGANFTLKDIAGNQQSSLTASNDNFQYKSSYINTSSISSDIWTKEVKLSWSNNQAKDVDGFWYIYRYKTDEGPSKGQFTDEYPSTDFPYPFLNSETEGGKASYTDHSEDLLYDVSYTYIFQYVPKTWSDVKQLFLDRFIIQPNKLERKFNINLSITSHEDHISLNWNSDQFQDGKQHEFRIFRKEGAKGKFVEIAKVGSNMEATYDYDDYDISSGCATYYYKVTTSSLFPDKNYPSGLEYSSDTTKSGSMTTESQVLSLEATKGTYSNTVKLTWNARQTGTDETKYVIYRRDLNSDDSWVKLHTTSGTATVYAFDDNTALPGKYYEYKVASSFICSETGLETDPVEVFDDGFCRALGVISGRVTYGTGSAVNNAKVSVVKNSDSDIKQFHSLRVNGAGSGIQLPIDKKQGAEYFNKPWTIQLYVNPDASISDAKGRAARYIPLVKSPSNFGLYLTPKNSNEYYVSVLGPSSTEIQKTTLLIEANQFSHLTFSYNGKDKVTVRRTDEYGKITKVSKTIQSIDFKLEYDSLQTNPLLFGKSTKNEEVFKGYLDDIRIFSDKELTDQEILSNYNRILSGSEAKLVLYWPMDEGIKNQKKAYDYSKTSGVTNDNHGEIFAGSSISSEYIPTDSQLSIFGVTDTMGNYTINGIPFEGDGTTYMVIPSLGIHKFSPQYATRFVSASSLVHSGVDFEDVSSFPISGIVTYHNTNYPVEGANIYVDGVVCSKDGEMITTDANGEFTISVPIGDHHIQVKMKDHVFVNNGRFPSNSLLEYTFDREMSDKLEFSDSTFVTLTGRVAGGLPESKKPHGFGTGNATIGKATIELTFGEKSQFNLDPTTIRTYGNPSDSVKSIATTGKYDTPSSRSIIIHTDSATGEFAVSLPPVDYKVKSVKVDNNPDIAFSTENIEAILFGSGSLQTQTDSLVVSEGDTATFDYLYALDLIYRSNPVLELTSLSTPDGAFGDKNYIIKDDVTATNDTIPLYSVDSTTGKITYTLGYPIYTQGKKYDHKMYLYEPYSNFDSIVNGAKIERFVKIPLQGAAISVSNSLGATMVATTDGIDEKGNEVKAGQVMETANSSLTADSMGYVDYTFMATYPNIVEPYTLGLNINFEYGETTYEWAQNNKFSGIVTGGLSSGSNFITSGPDKVLYVLRDPPGTGSSAHIEKGQTITTSSKISTEYNSEYSANVTWKLGADVTSAAGIGFAVITENSVKADITAGVEISYNSTHERTNTYKLTTTENISTSDASDYVGEDGDVYIGSATNIIMGKCRKVAPVKDEEGNYSIDMVEAISLGEEFTTQFKYTQNYIESILIPNLEMTRNSFLKKVSKAEYNKNYKNNSDKTIYITTKNKGDKDFGSEGSYICIPLDPKNYTDTIGYFNTQIKLWKDQLAYNEQAKVKAIETVTDYNEEEYNLAAKKIEEAKMLENTTFLLFDPYVQHYVKLDSTFWFNKKGGSIKYADYGSNKAMIDNILDGYSISRSEYEKYLSTSKDKRNITLFYDTKKYGWKVKNVSFDAGTSIEESVERCGTVSSTDATNTQGLAVVGGKTGFAFCGLGFECELQTKQGGTEAFEESSETENCTAVGYTLADDGINDAMSVDIFQAPDGFGPIFYTRAGQTSCPFEDEKKTRFYEPGKHTLAVKTMQIEIPRITTGENNLKSQKIINIPSGSAANFTLNLDNLSETNENVWFNMYVVDETNPDGAALSIDGVPFATARQILVNALETTHKNLQIRQTRTDIMKYDSIAVVLSSNCQEEIADTIYLSVEFVPSCSPLTLQIDDRTMNSTTGDTLQLIVKDFEKDYLNFNEIRLQYKGERDNDWNLAKKLMVEDLDGARQVVSFPMSSNLFNDQTYQFRAISVCAKGASEIITNESETINLIKDMARPQVLGNPNPSDGILDAGDEISVTYNEDIRNSILSKGDNFVIEAVLNDAEVDHNVALKMDSTSNFAAATEASIGLANKSFTVDMWVNLSSGGTLLKHSSDKENFTVSVASTGKLTVNVNGTKATSTDKIPFNKWCFLTLSYNIADSSAAVSALVAYDAEEVSLLVDKKLPKYSATGTLSLGKNIRGAIGEVALWGTKRSNAESQSQMHFAKSASTENLIGYWKFNEGHGKVAKDVARSRNMALASDSWYLNNTNFAATLDGKSQLSLDITRSTSLSSDDYMMEMWFRGNSQKNATLWSANTKVALKFNANGYLTLLTDSVENQLSTTNYLDGAWHHVAMNVLRNGTTTIYMDGSIVKQLSSSKVPALQASELTIGAQRYSPSYAVYDYTDFFKGDVDEVRYWVATFNAKAIEQFRYIRLNGDEAGLEAYYPFEDIKKDAGITGYEFALKDMSANAIGKAKGTAKKAASAPALQAKPNMSKLNYSFVASERTVDITLNENASRLEGTTVNFTVKNVRDANNNFSLPVTWSAYINQNRLIWGDDAISLEKNVEDETSFSLSVVNQGAATESWSISNLPSWLTASKNNGSLSALKSETIEFEISNAVPTGSYEETIYLVGNEGISVPFTINLKVNVGKPDWSVDPSQFENSMSVIAQLKLDGNYSTDTEDLVAAFINGTCVGVASPKYYSRYDAYFVSLDIYGNSTDADKKVVFKAWDASTGVTYPTLSTSSNIKFSSNALFGSMKEPVILSSNKMQEQNLDLKKGWNWISLNVKPSNDSINAVFGDIANKANILKSKTNFSQSNGKEFSGALKNVKIGSMYKAQMNTAINYQVAGNAIDASKETVTIKSGWNWIGFNSTTTMSLNEAFADLNPVDGDMVKGQSGFAYYEGYEWVGTLTALNPGKGYMYKSVAKDNRTFKYPAKTSSLRALISKETTKETAYKTENETAYSGNMTIVAVVKDGNKVLDDVQIGIFDAKGKCRAAAATDDKSLAFLTVMGGESADALTIKVIYNGYEYVLEQDLVYADDATLGTLSNPYVIQLTPVDAITDVLNTSISVYPTLVETELNVKAESLIVTNYSISDISGRILINDEPNNSEFTINVSSLSQGAYILMMETEAGTIIKRFSKK